MVSRFTDTIDPAFTTSSHPISFVLSEFYVASKEYVPQREAEDIGTYLCLN